MGVERKLIKNIAIASALTLTAIEASKFAFTVRARKEIGKRDKWTCQGRNGDDCAMVHLNGGKPADFRSGYWVTAAHYPEEHQHTGHGYHDPDPNRGRILCTIDHAIEELHRGNEWGAEKLLQQGVYNVHHQRQTGEQWKPTLDELREIESELSQQQKSSHYQEPVVVYNSLTSPFD